ncbi:MAG: hypothetical protein U0235_13590 [Polyangiaceae bacterium]
MTPDAVQRRRTRDALGHPGATTGLACARGPLCQGLGVLVSVQRFRAPAIDARRDFYGAFHPRLWIHVVDQIGCLDEALFPNLGAARPQAGRRLVGLSLSGISHARFSERTFVSEPGAGVTCDGRSAFRGRAESLDDVSARSIVIDWDVRHFGGPRAGGTEAVRVSSLARLAAHVDALVLAIARTFRDERGPRLEEASAALLGFLHAEGLDVPRLTAADLIVPPEPELQAMSRALDQALSLTDEMPMLVDVEATAGASIRTIQRWLPRIRKAWGHDDDGDGFRALRARVVAARACLFMSRPGATTEGAARFLGFASPNALCRRFAEAGLPSPGQVRQRLHAIA